MAFFLRLFQRLLPLAKAWQITLDTTMRQFFDGLTGLPDSVRTFFDDRFEDRDPQTTQQLDEWEQQFGLPATVTVEQERRDRLAAAWQALGGQSPRYIQDTVQADTDFADVFVHEFWSARTTPSDAAPTIRDPIADAGLTNTPEFSFVCDSAFPTVCTASPFGPVCGAISVATGFILVNKDDGVSYGVPTNADDFPYVLYIGAQTFPNLVQIPIGRRDEFETLLLSICPGQQWLGMLVEYV
ncbi:MAG: hypothetical protein V3W41_14505 [Planctomycetota bacterium]